MACYVILRIYENQGLLSLYRPSLSNHYLNNNFKIEMNGYFGSLFRYTHISDNLGYIGIFYERTFSWWGFYYMTYLYQWLRPEGNDFL